MIVGIFDDLRRAMTHKERTHCFESKHLSQRCSFALTPFFKPLRLRNMPQSKGKPMKHIEKTGLLIILVHRRHLRRLPTR